MVLMVQQLLLLLMGAQKWCEGQPGRLKGHLPAALGRGTCQQGRESNCIRQRFFAALPLLLRCRTTSAPPPPPLLPCCCAAILTSKDMFPPDPEGELNTTGPRLTFCLMHGAGLVRLHI